MSKDQATKVWTPNAKWREEILSDLDKTIRSLITLDIELNCRIPAQITVLKIVQNELIKDYKSVNCHDDLVEALRYAKDYIFQDHIGQRVTISKVIEQALAKVDAL